MLGLILAGILPSCSQNKFERIEQTRNERYSIVYKGGKCGIYDNDADSLVTELKYDKLVYGRVAREEDVEFTVWTCEIEGSQGLLSIGGDDNTGVEILMP